MVESLGWTFIASAVSLQPPVERCDCTTSFRKNVVVSLNCPIKQSQRNAMDNIFMGLVEILVQQKNV